MQSHTHTKHTHKYATKKKEVLDGKRKSEKGERETKRTICHQRIKKSHGKMKKRERESLL